MSYFQMPFDGGEKFDLQTHAGFIMVFVPFVGDIFASHDDVMWPPAVKSGPNQAAAHEVTHTDFIHTHFIQDSFLFQGFVYFHRW